jgi:hypothetical protein
MFLGAQRLRVDLTMWENRFRSKTTQIQNLTQRLEASETQRKNAQARLEVLQEVRRMEGQGGGMAARGRGRGGGKGGPGLWVLKGISGAWWKGSV